MLKIIILNNKKCQIVCDDLALLKKLHHYLSFKLVGVEYTPAYQNGWNGITYLLTKNNKFNLGLLEKVKSFLSDNGADFIIEDKRFPKILNPSLDLSNKLKEYNLVPREHQIRVSNLVDVYDRGIIRAATASGKSLMTALITAKLNKSTNLYVIGLDLLKQFHDLFSKLFEEKIGYIGDGICEVARINIISIWTAGRALKLDKKHLFNDEENEQDVSEQNKIKIIEALKSAKVHIIDESHCCSSETIDCIYKCIDPEYIYGFSGTPFREDGSNLLINGILGEQIIDISASELIEKGLLAKPIIKFVQVPKPLEKLERNYQSVYKNYIVENEIRNNLILQNTLKLIKKGYQVLVLFNVIKHGKILFELFKEHQIKCALLDGSDNLEERGLVKIDLMNHKLDCLIASKIMDIGVDIPSLSALVLGGSGKSFVRATQRIGRILRAYPGKKHVIVIDFYDRAPFVESHAKTRHKIYSLERGFEVGSLKK